MASILQLRMRQFRDILNERRQWREKTNNESVTGYCSTRKSNCVRVPEVAYSFKSELVCADDDDSEDRGSTLGDDDRDAPELALKLCHWY